MTPEAAEARILALREELSRHNHLYYVKAAPEISDREFDALLEELIGLEKGWPQFHDPASPSLRVGGAPLEHFDSVEHVVPMLSLSNTYDLDELRDFHSRLLRLTEETDLTYIVEPKIDGVAISLTYIDGVLTTGATRGDGTTGDDITANLRTLGSIPLTLHSDSPPERIDIRGEVYMENEGFAELNRQRQEAGKEVFANPRNASAGSLKMLDSSEVARRPLTATLYGIAQADPASFPTHEALLGQLSDWGCPAPRRIWKAHNEESLD